MNEKYVVTVGNTKKGEEFDDFRKAYEWAVSELGAGEVTLWQGEDMLHRFHPEYPFTLEKLAYLLEIDLDKPGRRIGFFNET